MVARRKKAERGHEAGDFYLARRGEYWHIYGRHDGRRYRKSTDTKDIRIAKIALDTFVREVTSEWRDDVDADWKVIAKALWVRHRQGASRRGIPFSLTPSYIYAMMRAHNFHCELSGIQLDRRPLAQGTPNPWAPSIDRIVGQHGYVKGNVRVVCVAANLGMNRFGYDVLLRLAHGVVRSATPVHEDANRSHRVRFGPDVAAERVAAE